MSSRGIIKERSQHNAGNVVNSNQIEVLPAPRRPEFAYSDADFPPLVEFPPPAEVEEWRALEIFYEDCLIHRIMKGEIQLKPKGACKTHQRLIRALQLNLLKSVAQAPKVRDQQSEQDYRRHLEKMAQNVRRLQRETTDQGHLDILEEIEKKIAVEEELILPQPAIQRPHDRNLQIFKLFYYLAFLLSFTLLMCILFYNFYSTFSF